MREREQLLRDIGIADFVLIELALYLDTHPHDRRAMEYFNHYNRIKNQMEKGPLCPGKESAHKCGVMRRDWNSP